MRSERIRARGESKMRTRLKFSESHPSSFGKVLAVLVLNRTVDESLLPRRDEIELLMEVERGNVLMWSQQDLHVCVLGYELEA